MNRKIRKWNFNFLVEVFADVCVVQVYPRKDDKNIISENKTTEIQKFLFIYLSIYLSTHTHIQSITNY